MWDTLYDKYKVGTSRPLNNGQFPRHSAKRSKSDSAVLRPTHTTGRTFVACDMSLRWKRPVYSCAVVFVGSFWPISVHFNGFITCFGTLFGRLDVRANNNRSVKSRSVRLLYGSLAQCFFGWTSSLFVPTCALLYAVEVFHVRKQHTCSRLAWFNHYKRIQMRDNIWMISFRVIIWGQSE